MDILSAIGNTQLVELNNLNSKNPKVRIFGKLEAANPGGSVKDRPAYYMIKAAEAEGKLKKGMTITEATSGNTGIALAMIGAAKGYRVKLFMPECVSTERINILQAFGAEVILTPAGEGTDGAINRVRQLSREEPEKYYMPDQFSNPNNSLAHYETTGPELSNGLKGEITHFVAGMGTSGTLMGAGRYFRERNPEILIIGVEPPKGHSIQGLKNMNESIVPEIYDESQLDKKITIEDNEAFEIARKLATAEGLLLGMSSGAAIAGALKIARKIKSGTIVTVLPDRGDRYLSTVLFRSICAKCPP